MLVKETIGLKNYIILATIYKNLQIQLRAYVARCGGDSYGPVWHKYLDQTIATAIERSNIFVTSII